MCVGLLVTSVSPCPANMVEPIVIEMPFGVWTLGVQLTMYSAPTGPDPPVEGALLDKNRFR